MLVIKVTHPKNSGGYGYIETMDKAKDAVMAELEALLEEGDEDDDLLITLVEVSEKELNAVDKRGNPIEFMGW